MTTQTSMEQRVYAPISNATSVGLRDFEPELFQCWPGSVLVVQATPEAITKGGIVIPDNAKEDQTWGVVAAIPGEGTCRLKPGDRVFFRPHSGDRMLFKGRTDLLLLKFEDGVGSEILGWIPSENCT